MLRRMRNRILLAALLLASLVCVGFARQAPPERAAWEYHATCGRVELNKLGADGWELATATQDGNVTCLYFKRRK
jgi:hypothetical protein